MANYPPYPGQVPQEPPIHLYGGYPWTHGPGYGWYFNPGDPHALNGQLPRYLLPGLPHHSCGHCRGIAKHWKLKAAKLTTPRWGYPLSLSNRWAGEFLLIKQPWNASASHFHQWCAFNSVFIPEDEWNEQQAGYPWEGQASWTMACEFGTWFLIAWAIPETGVGVYDGLRGGELFRTADGRDTTTIHDPKAIVPHNISIWFLNNNRFRCHGRNEFHFYGSGPSPHPYSGGEVNSLPYITVEAFWP